MSLQDLENTLTLQPKVREILYKKCGSLFLTFVDSTVPSTPAACTKCLKILKRWTCSCHMVHVTWYLLLQRQGQQATHVHWYSQRQGQQATHVHWYSQRLSWCLVQSSRTFGLMGRILSRSRAFSVARFCEYDFTANGLRTG